MKKVIITILVFCYLEVQCVKDVSKLDNSLISSQPCNGTKDIVVAYKHNAPLEEENQYLLIINKTVTKNTKIVVTLNADGNITLKDTSFARLYMKDRNTFEIRVFKLHDDIVLIIKGQIPRTVPYITSLILNNKEHCNQPLAGYLDGIIPKEKSYGENKNKRSKRDCGTPKVVHTKATINGASTKPGDWPWHTAIYKQTNTEIKYICGGTLISKDFVLTAAQCTSLKGVVLLPETISVFLGKFNLIGGDVGSQKTQVNKIIVHEKFEHQNLKNDIALLKLKTEVEFSDIIQPACVWYSGAFNNLPNTDIFGTIVGWGFDSTDSWSPHLQQIKMPMVSQSTCLKSNPLVYTNILNSNKFCAGYGVQDKVTRSGLEQGTSSCNGDRGSAFQVFVPDNSADKSTEPSGTWYVRGIVSLTVPRRDSPICDPEQYIVFTDVEKYKGWIDLHLEN